MAKRTGKRGVKSEFCPALQADPDQARTMVELLSETSHKERDPYFLQLMVYYFFFPVHI